MARTKRDDIFNAALSLMAEKGVYATTTREIAGRAGTAILFVTPRQQRLLREIERYTRQKIEPMNAVVAMTSRAVTGSVVGIRAR